MAFRPEMSLLHQLLLPKFITLFVWYTCEIINTCIWRRPVWGSDCESTVRDVSCLLLHQRAHFTVIRSQNCIRCKPKEIGSHSVTLKHVLILSSAVWPASRRVSSPQIFLLWFYMRFSYPSCMLTQPVFGDDCSL
jgi:hypothetical protein